MKIPADQWPKLSENLAALTRTGSASERPAALHFTALMAAQPGSQAAIDPLLYRKTGADPRQWTTIKTEKESRIGPLSSSFSTP